MMRTLITLLAAAAISLPAAAQQRDTRQGSEQNQSSQPGARNLERGPGGGQRATNRGGEDRDRVGRMGSGEHGKGQRAEHQFRGRAGYEGRRGFGVRGRAAYEEYDRGRGIYARACPRYTYIDGRRVLNERCLGYTGSRGIYSRDGRGRRYSYYRGRRVFSEKEYGDRRGGGVYSGRRAAIREYGRNRGSERPGANERRGVTGREESGQRGSASSSQGNRPDRSARRGTGAQTQTEPQPGTR
jgi:hypothetical protein